MCSCGLVATRAEMASHMHRTRYWHKPMYQRTYGFGATKPACGTKHRMMAAPPQSSWGSEGEFSATEVSDERE